MIDMFKGINNSPQTTLSSGILIGTTSIAIDLISAVPTAPNLITIGSDDSAEVVKYAGISGSTLTGCTRGFGGTTAKAWDAGDSVYRGFTKYDHDTFVDNIDELASASGGGIGKTLIINGNLAINQEVYVSGATLDPAALGHKRFGHDRFKAGASGGDYTFATVENLTTATIAAGKSLIQIVEGVNFQSGTHVLSWTGTAQCQIDGGGYDDSGMTATLTGGTDAVIEIDAGTFTNLKLEAGSVATEFVGKTEAEEIEDCRTYFQKFHLEERTINPVGGVIRTYFLGKLLRAVPTISYTETSGSAVSGNISCDGTVFQIRYAGANSGGWASWYEADFELDAEL